MAIREFDGELDAAPQFREFDGKLDGDGGRTAKSIAGDVGVSLLKGAIGLPEAVVGLADIPTGGRVGRALESIGYRPAEAKKIADEWFSDEQKAANKAVQEADGFVGTLAESVKNPSTIAMTALESAPSMLGGAGIARGVMKVAPKIAPVIAGAVGEGAVTAGQTAAQIREESKDGLLTPKQSLSAVGAGAVTGILGFAGGKLAQKAGIADVDTLLASGQGQQVAKGFARQVVGSGISEGVFEELPQSMQEQMWQNYATGKPIMEGVGKAGATGMLAGMAMGAVGGAGNAAMPKIQQSADESAVPVADLYPEAEVTQPAQPEQAEVVPVDMGMQNRDRGTAASIMQMQSIANAPDFDRLGASPIPDVGAPLVSVKDNAEGAIAPEDMGATGEVTLPDGSKVGFRYAVVDAGAVLASHGVDGRTNPAYADAQPGQIVALNNGRTAGLQEAYARGSASQQGGYMDRLISGAADFGLNPQAVAGKQNPVLVRVYDDKVNTRPDIAKQANSGGSMGMSAQEVARNDAAILPDLRNLVINDQGEFDPAANAPFVRGWVASLPQNEQAEVTDRAGNLSQTGFTRLRNAVIARAYGDNSVFGRLVESLDTDMRNVGKALVKAAPKIAQVRELIAAGAARDMDIGGQINQAVNDLVKLRQAGMSLADFLAQAHLFAEHKTAPEVLEILSFLDANLRAPNRIADFLAGYYAMVESLGSPKQDDMFGAPQVERGDLIRSAAASALPQNELLGATDERNGTGVADRGGEETTGSTAAVAEGITGGEAAPAVPGPDLVGGDVRQESGSPEGGSADAGSDVAQPAIREIADADLQLDEPKTAIGKEARKLKERAEQSRRLNDSFVDGAKLSFADVHAFLERFVYGKGKGESVPNPEFVVGRFSESGIREISNFIDGFNESYAEVRVSGRSLKHTDEQRHDLLKAVIGDLPSIIASAPIEVLHNPSRENSAFVVYRRAKEDGPNALVVVEISKNGSGTDIVNVIASRDRQLNQYKKRSDAWLDGRLNQEGQSHHPVNNTVPAEGGFSDFQPSTVKTVPEENIGVDTPRTEIGKEARKLRERKEAKKAEQSSVRGEVGALLTKDQRKAVLKTLVDVYRKNNAPKEFKGVDSNGNERSGYAHSPEYFVKSDITGAMVRYYVTLPDGRIAHPTELFPDYSQSDIDAAMQKEIDAEREQERNDRAERERLISLAAPTINEANRKFNHSQRFANDRDSIIPALLTNGQLYLRSRPEFAEKAANLLGGGWKPLWSGASVPTVASGANPLAVSPPDAGAATTMTPGQSSETTVAPENDNGNTADAGEELTYNKRNRRSGGLKWDDIKDKNAALRVKEVVKSKVYPKPDYQALVDGGMKDVVAHIVKQSYDAIAPSPKLKRGSEPTDEVLRSYINAVNRVMDGVMKWASDENAVGNWAAKQAKLSGASISVAELAASASLLDTVYPDGWRANRDELVMLGGNKLLGALQPGYDEVSRALRDIKLGWPAKAEAWQKQGFKVVHVENLIVDLYASPAKQDRAAYVSGMFSAGKQRIDSFVVHGTDNKEETTVQEIIADRKRQLDGKYVLLDKAGRAHGVFESESAASEAAREKARKESGEKISEKGVSVEVAERSGIEHRLPGDNVTSERLMETFGFRGVNFGNWMKGDTKAKVAERQLHLNHLYDAFMDLAELLNLPPKAMSLNGMLGIAVGAQGSGKALAHFVPGVNEINVTRTKGAGALAHEWAHALDHYFAAVAGIERKADPFLTAHVGTMEGRTENGKYVRSPIDLGELRPEVAAQFKAIVDAMSERKETKDEYEDRLKGEKGRAGRLVAEEIKKITNAIEKAKESWGTPELIAKIRGLSERIASLDYGDGRVSVADGEVPAVVAEIAEAYRDASGVPLANAYALGYHADRYKVISDLLESSERWEPRTVSTDYQKASDTADAKKKKYWSSKFEMFARAFDAFVVDSLAEQDGKNTYLSGVEAVAPQGEERKAIGRAFDFLFSELKTRETERGIALFSRTISIPGTIHLDDLNAIAATFRKAYPGVPVVVLEKERQAPKSLRDKIKEAGAGGTVAGAFHEGSIYLIREGIRNIEHGQHVVVHEGVHAGLHKMFGDSISPILLDIWQNNLKIQLTAKKIKDKYGYSQVTSIEEALADMGPDVKKLKGWSRLVAWVRAKLRKLGWVKEWTDNDVEALVLRALSSIKNGGQTSIYKGTAFSENSPFDNMRRKLTGSDSKLTAALTLLAESDALFQQPAAFGGTVQDVAREINPEYVVKPLGPSLAKEKGADRAWEIGVPKSRFRTAFLYEKGNQVWLDLQHLLPGIDAGNVVYGIAAGYAHNTGKVLIGDPAGLSRLAFFRRTENMISSILKYGTSDHLEPHRAQIDPAGYYAETGHHEFGQMVRAIDWEPGNTAHNLKELIYTAYKGALHYMPELKDVYYDFDRRDFVRARPGTAGVPVPGDFFTKLSERVSAGSNNPYRAGSATQKRVALYNSMVRAAGDPVRWRRIVAEIGRQLHGASATGAERALDPALEKTFYSRFDQSETINVDGVERPALNSNGKPIAPTEEGLRNFWRWMNETNERRLARTTGQGEDQRGIHRPAERNPAVSRFLFDDAGRPRVFFHGTASDFASFDLDHAGRLDQGWLGRGVYLASDSALAEYYAKQKGGYEPGGMQNIMPLYVAIHNPLVANTDTKAMFRKASKAAIDQWTEKAVAAGYDGVILEFSDGDVEVVAFDPAAVKSASGNNGDFDPGKSDIRFSRADQNETAPTPQELAEAKVARILSKRRKSGPLETVTKAATKAIGVDRATAFAGGKVRQLFDALVPESWKAGIVADYGIPEAVTDRRDMMFGHMRRQLREAENTLVRLSTLTRQESRIAYEWMNNRNAEHLLDQLPEDSRKVLLDLKRSIDDMGKEAVRLGQLEADTYERHAMAYLHRSYRKWELEANDSEKRTRAKAIKVLGDQYKGRGLTDLPAMSAIKNAAPDWWNRKTQQGKADKQLKGQKFIRFERRDNRGEGAGMLPGMEESGQLGKLREVNYWPAGEPVPAKYAAWHNAGTWEARDTKGDKVVMWRDFTPDERVKMGEIDEVRFAVAKTLHKMTHDLEVGKFFEWLAANQAKPEDKLPPEARVVDARESLTATFGKDDWVQVPDAKIPGTRVKRYGSLAGLYVPGPIWNDIRQIANVRHNPLGEHYAAILKVWKLSKTALSPAVHLNNIMSNFVMADWHDVTGRDVLDALTILVNQKKDEASRKIVEMFEDAGGTQGLYALSEIQREQLSPLVDQLRKEVGMADTTGEVGVYAALQALVRFRFGDAIEMASMTKPGRISAKALNKIIDIYSSEDTVFRLAAFMKAKREGASDIEAGRAARKSFLDYQINAPWIQMLRQTAFPFIAFTYRAVPMLLNTIEQKPWKLMKLSIFLGAANALGYALSGGDEDKERKLLPEEKAGGVLGGVAPKLIRMPWNYEMTDREGGQTVAPVFLDIRRFIPMGDIVDLGQTHSAVPILPMALPGGPLAVLAELIANKSQFTGRELTLETDTGMEKAGKVADHLYKAFAPNLIGLPWTYATESVLRAGSGRTDAFGREQSLAMAGLSSVGVKLGAYPGDVLRMNADLAFKRDEAEIKRGIRAKQREFSRNGMSEESFREALQRDIEKLKKRRQEYADKVQ
ncbi:hypothetical protein PTW32_10835 [Dechloromonas agitata]|uniref:ADP-ribosyltransferase-containing protein n=1 Tax=Dechloromonas agitata TaxID=73030 RepID=UPI00237E2B28|nr:LPD1 domain-containing protein [Dechloromonas agitata]MDE1545915.1 hypothetical protein [Dechloromonas agitata]